jgi:hypothetical protein
MNHTTNALIYIKTTVQFYKAIFPRDTRINWNNRCRVLGDRPNIIAQNFIEDLDEYKLTEEVENITLIYWNEILLNNINHFLDAIHPSLNFRDVEELRISYELARLSTANAHSTREAFRYAEQIRRIEELRQEYENRLFNILDYEVDQMPNFREVEHLARININMNGTIAEFRELLNYMTGGDNKQIWIVNKLQRKINKKDWKQSLPEECAVCCEKISQVDYLSCGHCIHKKCIIKSKKTTCPCCREEIELTREELEQYN